MRTLITIAAVLISGSAAAYDNPLTRDLGRMRPLIVVAPGVGDGLAAALQRVLTDPATVSAFTDRQIVIYTVFGGQGARDGHALDDAASASVLQRIGQRADGPGAVVLVGKDGGVKLRLTHLAVGDILSAVDQMPMRRQETRQP